MTQLTAEAETKEQTAKRLEEELRAERQGRVQAEEGRCGRCK